MKTELDLQKDFIKNPEIKDQLEFLKKGGAIGMDSFILADAFLKGIRDDAIGEITMDELEREIIERTLKNCSGNRRKTAKILDISERTLYRKLKEYEIN